MRYLCLAYGDERKCAALSRAELEEMGMLRKSPAEALRPGGPPALVASLSPTRSATTLRPREGKAVLCDGPYADGPAQVGAIFILEAENLDEAIRAASRHPAARLGERLGSAVEIRPIDFYVANEAALG